MNIVFFDTETTGFPQRGRPFDDPSQPHIVQIAAILAADHEEEVASLNVVIKPDGWTIPDSASNVHGIGTEYATMYGVRADVAMLMFNQFCCASNLVVAHNIDFDAQVVHCECARLKMSALLPPKRFCTMHATTNLCKLPGKYDGYKWPKLIEAYQHLFNETFKDAHDALADVRACMRIYFELQKQGASV